MLQGWWWFSNDPLFDVQDLVRFIPHSPFPSVTFGQALTAVAKCRYHFTCVDITEPQAGEISTSSSIGHPLLCYWLLYLFSDVYICPTCTITTRRRSASELNFKISFLAFHYVPLHQVCCAWFLPHVVLNLFYSGHTTFLVEERIQLEPSALSLHTITKSLHPVMIFFPTRLGKSGVRDLCQFSVVLRRVFNWVHCKCSSRR